MADSDIEHGHQLRLTLAADPRTVGVGDSVCFFTAGPITKLFAWGGGG